MASDTIRPLISAEEHEALRQRFNPDGSPLRNHQLRMLEMLEYFDALCKKHNITYWLSSGNCIGAVRHGGFVPWDDDIDVEMMRDDYLKLLEVFEETDDYVLQTHDNDPFFMVPFAKLRDKHSEVHEMLEGKDIAANYKYKGIFIDIFYIEPAPWLPVRVIDSLTYRVSLWGLRLNRNDKNRLFHLTRSLLFKTSALMRKLFSSHSSRLFPTYGSGFHNARSFDDNLTETIDVKFENRYYPIPKKYDTYLRRIYGDYTKLPDFDSVHVHIPSLKKPKS